LAVGQQLPALVFGDESVHGNPFLLHKSAKA